MRGPIHNPTRSDPDLPALPRADQARLRLPAGEEGRLRTAIRHAVHVLGPTLTDASNRVGVVRRRRRRAHAGCARSGTAGVRSA